MYTSRILFPEVSVKTSYEYMMKSVLWELYFIALCVYTILFSWFFLFLKRGPMSLYVTPLNFIWFPFDLPFFKRSWRRFVDFLERVQPAKTGLEITYNKRPLEYAKQYPQPVESWPRARESPRYSSPPPANQYGQVGFLNARGKCGKLFFVIFRFCMQFLKKLIFNFLKSKFVFKVFKS